jgi:hypothetical protein
LNRQRNDFLRQTMRNRKTKSWSWRKSERR